MARNLAVDITARDKTGRAFQSVKNNVRSLNNTLGGVKKLLGAVFVGAAVKGILVLARNAIQAADDIGKASDAIGLGVVALQEYRFALDLAGVAQETTDKGLKKFTRKMGDLARSSSETQTALKDLDPVLLKNLRSLGSVEARLEAAFDALGGYSDQSKRAAVASALFGRAGIEMTVAIKGGSEALRESRAELRRLGGVMDEELIRKAEAANDELTRLSTVISSQATAAFVAFLPDIKAIGGAFAELVRLVALSREGFTAMPEKGVARLKYDLERIESRISNLRSTLADPKTQPKLMGPTNKALLKALTMEAWLRGRIAFLTAPVAPVVAAPKTDGFDKTTRAAIARGEKKQIADAKKALAELNASFGPLTAAEKINPFGGFAKGAEDAMQRARDLTAALNEQAKAFAEEGQRVTEAVNPLAAHAAEMVRLNILLSRGAINQDTFARAARQANERLNEQKRSANLAAVAIDDVMGAAINGQIKSWEDLGRVAVNVLGDIVRAQLRATAAARGSGIGGFLSSALQTIFGTGGMSFGTGGGVGASYNLTSSQAVVGQFAHGGNHPGGLRMVGERGPEIEATGPSRIFSADKTAKMLQGGNTTIYIDARGSNGDAAVEAAVARGISAAAPSLINASVTKVRSGLRRDPRFAG